MTGSNFKMMNRTSKSKEIQEKINDLKNECGKLENINTVREYSFDNQKHDRLIKRIERLEYIKYCTEYEDNKRRTWK